MNQFTMLKTIIVTLAYPLCEIIKNKQLKYYNIVLIDTNVSSKQTWIWVPCMLITKIITLESEKTPQNFGVLFCKIEVLLHTYFIRLLGLNERIFIKCLQEFLGHNKCSMNVIYYYEWGHSL